MRIARSKRLDIANGTGLRYSIWVTGCSHQCKGCFNQELWKYDSEDSKPYTQEIEDEIIRDILAEGHNIDIAGLSILGGEPFEAYSRTELTHLVRRLKIENRHKNVWIWSGYLWEDLIQNPAQMKLLTLCDVIVDGKFIEEEKDLNLKFRGSSNQRIIDVKESLKQGKVILLNM